MERKFKDRLHQKRDQYQPRGIERSGERSTEPAEQHQADKTEFERYIEKFVVCVFGVSEGGRAQIKGRER